LEGLGINPGFLLSQIVNFLILFVALYFLLWKRVLRTLDERRRRIQEGLENAERARQELARIEEEYQRRVAEGQAEAERIKAQALQEAEQAREEVLEKARAEAEKILAQARAEAEVLRREALVGMREQIVDLALTAASKVIGEALDEQAHRQLIEKFIAEVGEQP